MKKQSGQPISLMSWTLWRPLRFAIISFAIMCGVGALYSLIVPHIMATPIMWPLWVLFGICLGGTTYLMLRRMPRGDLSQRGFIALDTLQIIVMYLALFGTVLVATQLQRIAYQMMMAGHAGNTWFVITVAVVSIFALYMVGLGLSNLYAKFRRARSMGVPAWAAILSMPFSFGLFWIPGYILPDTTTPESCVTIRPKWYDKLSQKIADNIIASTLAFVILTLVSGLLAGMQTLLVTGIILAAFFAWAAIYGVAKFKKNIGGAYSLFAVCTNIIMIIATIILIAINANQTPQNVTMNISDVTPEMTE